MKTSSAFLLCLLMVAFPAFSATNFYYSLDIGSDWEFSDPTPDGNEFYDPGDIYFELSGPSHLKDDGAIFGVDPAPLPPVPVGLVAYSAEVVTNYFDLDGEDQLDSYFELYEPGLYPAMPGGGLYLNPDKLFYSLDDDQASGWFLPSADVPVTVTPDRGAATNEILLGIGWFAWLPTPGNPVKTETDLMLIPDPGLTAEDDDVDALDLELRRYWYWSADHEATYGTDPGCIYVTDTGGVMPTIKAVDYTLMGLLSGVDVDGFEFIVTDDPTVLQAVGAPLPGPYLALLFSVDQNDPLTPMDESSGLNPAGIYISLLNGTNYLLSVREDDVDALTVMEKEPEPTPLYPKWVQEPDCEMGLDVPSWRETDLGSVGPRCADDWWCDGRPIEAIRWWGSYLDYESTNSADVPPPEQTLRPLGFQLTWYQDIPATTGRFSRPAGVVRSDYYPLAYYGSSDPGAVSESLKCVTAYSFLTNEFYEHEYEYVVELTNDWNEKAGRVYWLGVEAVYSMPPTMYPWGWKTTPWWRGWNDAAVWSMDGTSWTNIDYPPMGWGWITNHPWAGLPVDFSFELLTTVGGRRCNKWAQSPDMLLGQDMQSWSNGVYAPKVRADDFISDGRPITDVHWWGSYLNWWHDWPGSETNPIPAPTGAYAPLGFMLSWHAHDETFCIPSALITNIFVNITNCHEMYYGSVTQFWESGLFEHEYQYYVDLLGEGVESPWLEEEGVHYWLNIQAVFPVDFVLGEAPHNGWGWKITPAENNQLCFSVVSTNDGATWATDQVWTDGGMIHPRAMENFDLAFELTTTSMPTVGLFPIAAFTDIRAFLGGAYLWSTGYCGCGRQIMQGSIDLSVGEPGWSDIITNALPSPQNIWPDSPLTTQKFYRIRAVP